MKVAIITARGGSKRIPKKNIKEFCGKPIIGYSIEAAFSSNIFDEVMVSTDDLEISEISKRFGAKVPFLRSSENSDDFATTADVLLEVIHSYNKTGKNFDSICCIYPTAPFITGARLKEANNIFTSEPCDSLLPVVEYSFTPYRSVEINNNFIMPRFKEHYLKRSQDLTPLYHDCGQFYFIKTEALQLHRSLITDRTIPYIIAESEVQDIDTPEDWVLAEFKYRYANNKGC